MLASGVLSNRSVADKWFVLKSCKSGAWFRSCSHRICASVHKSTASSPYLTCTSMTNNDCWKCRGGNQGRVVDDGWDDRSFAAENEGMGRVWRHPPTPTSLQSQWLSWLGKEMIDDVFRLSPKVNHDLLIGGKMELLDNHDGVYML